MSLIEGYRKNVWTITVTGRTLSLFFYAHFDQMCLFSGPQDSNIGKTEAFGANWPWQPWKVPVLAGFEVKT
jgi:hypothetical protein